MASLAINQMTNQGDVNNEKNKHTANVYVGVNLLDSTHAAIQYRLNNAQHEVYMPIIIKPGGLTPADMDSLYQWTSEDILRNMFQNGLLDEQQTNEQRDSLIDLVNDTGAYIIRPGLRRINGEWEPDVQVGLPLWVVDLAASYTKGADEDQIRLDLGTVIKGTHIGIYLERKDRKNAKGIDLFGFRLSKPF